MCCFRPRYGSSLMPRAALDDPEFRAMNQPYGRTAERGGRTECARLGGIYRALRGARSAGAHTLPFSRFVRCSIRRSRPSPNRGSVRFGEAGRAVRYSPFDSGFWIGRICGPGLTPFVTQSFIFTAKNVAPPRDPRRPSWIFCRAQSSLADSSTQLVCSSLKQSSFSQWFCTSGSF